MGYDTAIGALADGTRRRILEQLRRRPRSVGELTRLVPVSQPAVSQHLRVLREAGLVRVDRSGTRRIYRLSPEGFEPLRRYIESFWGDVLAAFGDTSTRHKARRGASR